MEKKDKAKVENNYSIFARYIREKVKKEEEKAKEHGKELTVKQKRRIRKKYTKRARIFASAILSAGLIGIAGYQLGKNNANQQSIQQETQEQETQEQETTWKDDIKVDIEKPNEILQEIESEISELKDEEILQYVKQQYVDEYNKYNEQKIKAEDIEIKKSTLGAVKKYSQSYKYMYDPYANVKNDGVYTVRYNGELLEDIVSIRNITYEQAYRDGREQKETHTENIYKVVAKGIDYCIGYEKYQEGKTSIGKLSTYKQRLINSVYQKEIKEHQSQKETQTASIKQVETNQETDEELEQ